MFNLARRSSCPHLTRFFSSTCVSRSNVVKIVEVGARDGLQNEKAVISTEVKSELITRLGRAGLKSIEGGSFVSPKWVPQMAGTGTVLSSITRFPNVHYPVLVPNKRGLDDLLKHLLDTPELTDEIAVFTAATDAFTQANLNTTIAGSLENIEPVVRIAQENGLRVRGYVSVVIACPYSGKTDYKEVRRVAKVLSDMGCYEVSLGDTVGRGTPREVGEMLEVVKKGVPVEKLAGHFHDTFGTAVANVFTALDHGVRTIDSSIAGLGGCPYSPGATGNVATEDVVYALQGSGYQVDGLHDKSLEELVDIGFWISSQLGRDNMSRAGRALQAQRQRQEVKAKL